MIVAQYSLERLKNILMLSDLIEIRYLPESSRLDVKVIGINGVICYTFLKCKKFDMFMHDIIFSTEDEFEDSILDAQLTSNYAKIVFADKNISVEFENLEIEIIIPEDEV